MSQQKILLVEDENILASTLNSNLISAGFSTIVAKDGEEGLALALSEKPDLILLDIVLPKMDGITLLKKLREDAWGKSVPVIVLSNLGAVGSVAESVVSGVQDYLVKVDWKIEDVIKRVRERLGT